jgi:hypothetical protein
MRGGPADDRTAVNLLRRSWGPCDAPHIAVAGKVIEVCGVVRGAAVSLFLLILIVVLEIALIADVALADRAERRRSSHDRSADRSGGWRRLWMPGAWRAS